MFIFAIGIKQNNMFQSILDLSEGSVIAFIRFDSDTTADICEICGLKPHRQSANKCCESLIITENFLLTMKSVQ